MFAPGAVTSGFSAWPNGVNPPAVKLVGTPGHDVGTSSASFVKRTVAAPPDPAIAARSLAPSRSEIVPPAPWKIENPGSPAALSAMTMPTAPASRARLSFAWYWQPPRLTSAIDPSATLPGASPRTEADSPRRSTPTSTSRWFASIHPCGMSSVGHERDPAEGPPGDTTENDASKTCEFVVAPTAIASGAVAGEPAVPRPKKSLSFPAETTGTTPARTTFATVSISASVRGIGLRAAAGEVDDVHPVADRLLERLDDLGRRSGAAAAERQRHVEDAVVPDVRARRDAAHVGDRRMARALTSSVQNPGLPAGTSVPSTPAITPATKVPWKDCSRLIEPAARAGAGEALGDDHLRRRPAARPLREAGRIREPVGERNACSLSTPSSTTATFTPSPFAPVSPANCGAPMTAGPRFRSEVYV